MPCIDWEPYQLARNLKHGRVKASQNSRFFSSLADAVRPQTESVRLIVRQIAPARSTHVQPSTQL